MTRARRSRRLSEQEGSESAPRSRSAGSRLWPKGCPGDVIYKKLERQLHACSLASKLHFRGAAGQPLGGNGVDDRGELQQFQRTIGRRH